jgi:hypothetical protein
MIPLARSINDVVNIEMERIGYFANLAESIPMLIKELIFVFFHCTFSFHILVANEQMSDPTSHGNMIRP